MKQSDSTPPTYGKLLKQERERLGLSQQALAERVDATFVTISNWERGKTMPGPYHRRLLSNLFGKSLKELGLLPDEPSSREQIEPSTQETHDTSTVSETPARMWNIPYARNLYFTGREDVLEHLHNILLSNGSAALTQPQAISGLGGIGKTQTAVEYGYRYRNHYQSVLWVRAESRELLISDFVSIASFLKLPEKTDEDYNRIVSAVKRWLEGNDQWLLILDNADDLEMVSEFIPSAGQGHTLLTTRTQATGTLAQGVEIEKMTPAVGALFLLRRAKLLAKDATLEHASIADQIKAKQIAETMDGLPLALDQAGAYIEETACSLADYLTLYRAHRVNLLKRRGRLVANHAEPVATTWSLSFEKVQQANPAAVELLRLCAFLHPDAIPEEIINEGDPDIGPILGPVAADPIELNDAINELRQFSLVRRDPDLKILKIHRLVQAVLKDGMNQAMQRQWAERTVRIVNRAFPIPKVEFAVWSVCQKYLPHAQICAKLIVRWNMQIVEAIRLLNNVGQYLQQRGQYAEAEPLLQHALMLGGQLLGPEHPDVAEILCNLGLVYDYLGRWERTEQLYQHAIAILERVTKPDQTEMTPHLDTLCSLYNNLGEVYIEQGRYEQAGQFLQRTYTLLERALGPEHITTAHLLNNLGWLYLHQAKHTQAESFLRHALAIRERVLGPENLYVAYTLSGLALLYFEQGGYSQAELLFQRVLALREQFLGSMHLEVAQTLNYLAALYSTRGKYVEAEQLFQRAITIKENTVGVNHWEVAQSLQGRADLYRKQGKYEQADLLYERALSIYEQSRRNENPNVAEILRGKALLCYSQGRYVEAEQLFHRALALQEQSLGPEHPDVARTLNGLATLYREQGNYKQAEPLLQRALFIYEQSSIPEHPDVAITLENYAVLLRKTCREVDALPLEERARAIQGK